MQASTHLTSDKISCHKLPVLRRNDKQKTADETVKILQQRLIKFGFNLKADGFFGAKTETAVKEFQDRSHEEIGMKQLVVDGIVGPQTWEALGACIIISDH